MEFKEIQLNLDHLGESDWKRHYPNLFPHASESLNKLAAIENGTPVSTSSPPESPTGNVVRNSATFTHASGPGNGLVSVCGVLLKPGMRATSLWDKDFLNCPECIRARDQDILHIKSVGALKSAAALQNAYGGLYGNAGQQAGGQMVRGSGFGGLFGGIFGGR